MLIMTSCGTTKNFNSTSGSNTSEESISGDGSSFQQAIVVKSISEEYEYVKNDCSDCRVIGQSLVFEKKKPYDILKVQNSDGDIVSYYFDISKFYGKGF